MERNGERERQRSVSLLDSHFHLLRKRRAVAFYRARARARASTERSYRRYIRSWPSARASVLCYKSTRTTGHSVANRGWAGRISIHRVSYRGAGALSRMDPYRDSRYRDSDWGVQLRDADRSPHADRSPTIVLSSKCNRQTGVLASRISGSTIRPTRRDHLRF